MALAVRQRWYAPFIDIRVSMMSKEDCLHRYKDPLDVWFNEIRVSGVSDTISQTRKIELPSGWLLPEGYMGNCEIQGYALEYILVVFDHQSVPGLHRMDGTVLQIFRSPFARLMRVNRDPFAFIKFLSPWCRQFPIPTA